MANLALSELLGARVIDVTGAVGGRVRELALFPQEDPTQVAAFIVRTPQGDRLLGREDIARIEGGKLQTGAAGAQWMPFNAGKAEGFLLLSRDLLDQQIIDVHGRKVVRVNDVNLDPVAVNQHIALKVAGVDVGARGAVRRLLSGMVPAMPLNMLLAKIPPRIIPWEFVNLIETDPARRVKLRIEHARLSRLHPADIADILEELGPAERGAVFESLDEEVAAQALEEIDRKMQVSMVDSVGLANIVLAEAETELAGLVSGEVISCQAEANEEQAAELFDKYNLLMLPVVDAESKLIGIITTDDVIAMLRRAR